MTPICLSEDLPRRGSNNPKAFDFRDKYFPNTNGRSYISASLAALVDLTHRQQKSYELLRKVKGFRECSKSS